MSKGYIKLYRELQDCWIWQGERFTRGQAWVDMLLMANHRDTKIPFDKHLEVIKRGQFITSINRLSAKWGWSFNTVKKFLDLLASDNMLIRKSDNAKTLITIVNYEVYQANDDDVDRQVDRPIDEPIDRPIDEQGANLLIPNKNDKNNTLSNDNVYNAQTSAPYSAHFEEFWKCYQKKNDKARAYEQYNARLKEGFSEEELLSACKNYMAECEREHREKKYIKDGKTFLSIHRPFIDYLPTKEEKAKDNIDIKKLFGLEFQQTPPYFGFPEQWFDGEELVRERVIPLVNPRDQEHGVSDDIPYSVQDLIDMFNARRRYFNGERAEIL